MKQPADAAPHLGGALEQTCCRRNARKRGAQAGGGFETMVSFAPALARLVRVRLTETPPEVVGWSVLRLRVYEAGTPQR